jgi:transposase
VATLAVTRRLDLTDEQWARLEALLSVSTRSRRPSAWAERQLIDGIRWRVRVGRHTGYGLGHTSVAPR